MSSATGNNNDNGRMAMYLLVMVVSALMLLFFVCSCKTTEYVEVPVVHTEYVYKESKDTAYVRDSVYIKEVQKGDTIRITEYRDRYRFRYITTTDTKNTHEHRFMLHIRFCIMVSIETTKDLIG